MAILKRDNMKKTFFLLIVFISVLTFNSCKKEKFKEGPHSTYRQAKKLLYGVHTITAYTATTYHPELTVDSLNYFIEHMGNTFNFYHDDAENFDHLTISGTVSDGSFKTYDCMWSYLKNGKSIWFVPCLDTNRVNPFFYNEVSVWEIIKLTKDEIKMRWMRMPKVYNIVLN